jgi:TatD DNase family protein
VTRQIVPAVDAASWPKLRDVCSRGTGLFPAYGLHPMYLDAHRSEHLAQLREWIERERPVAVGECGLDYFVEGLDRDTQSLYFDGQLRLARDFDLPVVVHARRAVDAVIAAIRKTGKLRGVVHSYSGSVEQARQLWDLGFLIGLGGRSPTTAPIACASWRAPCRWNSCCSRPMRQTSPMPASVDNANEPARLANVLAVIAQLRQQDKTDIAAVTTANAERLFEIGQTPDRGRMIFLQPGPRQSRHRAYFYAARLSGLSCRLGRGAASTGARAHGPRRRMQTCR